jgi:hypothetical protein
VQALIEGVHLDGNGKAIDSIDRTKHAGADYMAIAVYHRRHTFAARLGGEGGEKRTLPRFV